MKQYYIANRLSSTAMSEILGTTQIYTLNRRMADTVASAAMALGIKKTQNGQRLNFYSVNEDQLETMLAESNATMVALKTGLEWRPLLVVDQEVMGQKLEEVNQKYGGRMDYATHQKYLKDLIVAVTDSIKKINEDKKIERPKACNTFGIKVGDIVRERNGHRSSTNAIVTAVTDSGYEVRAWIPKHILWYYARRLGKDIDGPGAKDSFMGGFDYPIAGNEDEFEMGKPKRYKFSAKWENRNPKALQPGDWGYGVYSDKWDCGN